MKRNHDDLLTVCIIGYDGYSDLWGDCIGLLERFWSKCPYRIIFVNNELDIKNTIIEVIHAGKEAQWSQRVRVALDHITTQYVCLLLDDYYFGKEIDDNLITSTMDFIVDEKIRYYKLANMNRVVKKTDPSYNGIKHLHIISQSEKYGLCLQAAIWDVSFLSGLLGEGNYSAWKFEFDRVKESLSKPDLPNPGCVFDDRNILNLQHALIQGEFLPGTVKYFDRLGIKLNVQRKTMSYLKYYKFRLMSVVKFILPKKTHGIVKSFLELCGMKFVSTTRTS